MIEELIDLVHESGKHIIDMKKNHIFEGEWKGSQYKAVADRHIHELLVKRLNQISSDIPVVSEEDPDSWHHINSGEYFLIDPIDGTASYAQGFSGFVTQIALISGGHVKLAAIFAPLLGDTFWAVRDAGAFLNGKRLQITESDRMITLIDNYPEPRGIAAHLFSELHFKNYVESGSISLKICRVADQSADAFFKNVPVQQWDIAAPHLVIHECGGVLCTPGRENIDYSAPEEYQGIVAANSIRNAKRLLDWYSNFNDRMMIDDNPCNCRTSR